MLVSGGRGFPKMFALSKNKRSAELRQIEIENGKKIVDRTKENNIEAVRDLLNTGVNINAVEFNRYLFYKSQNYMTPLQVAAKNGFTEIVKLLVEWDGDGETANLNACDRFDTTAVHLAAEFGHTQCLRLLLDAGAECNLPIKGSKQGSYTVPHLGGTTPLHLATRENHLECVNELILNGADYNSVDEKGQTSLYIAAELGYKDIVMAHLQNAVGRDILSLPVYGSEETPLHKCVRHGHITCVEELLKHGSDVNHRNCDGFSAIHLALHNNDKYDFQMVKTLVQKGFRPNMNLPDKGGVHPLQYVCFQDTNRQERRPHVAAFLIAYGAQIMNIRNKHGMSILQAELQNTSEDMTILRVAVESLSKLPAWTDVGVISQRSSNAPPPFQQGPPHHHQQHQLHLHQQGHPNQHQQGPQHHHHQGPQVISTTTSTAGAIAAKWQWYRELCQSPRMLQHYCRCVVRKALLSNSKLREVRCLPLPSTLKHYLLLEYDEYR